MTSQQVRKLKSPQCCWPRPGDGRPSFFGPNLSRCSALLCCAKYRVPWRTVLCSCCAFGDYSHFSYVFRYVVLWCPVLYPLLPIQCCASWVTNFTSPYLAWHSIYLSKRKLIYPFLFKLVVLSDFRGLCDPCFWQNFDVEINIVKEKIGISIFIHNTVQHSSSVMWMHNLNMIGQKGDTICLPWHEETDDCNCAFVQ